MNIYVYFSLTTCSSTWRHNGDCCLYRLESAIRIMYVHILSFTGRDNYKCSVNIFDFINLRTMESNCFKTYQKIKKRSNKSTIIVYKELVNLLDGHSELKSGR